MAQFGRPSADTFIGAYKDQADLVANIFNSINEAVADDTNYVHSEDAPANSVYVTKLTAVTDPVSSVNHIVRFRYAKNQAGGAQIDLTVELRQGYVNEGTQGTLIKTQTFANISNVFTTNSMTLTGAEADSITDYTSLYLRFKANQV